MVSNRKPKPQPTPIDRTNLLPHFTSKLALELHLRMRARILEDWMVQVEEGQAYYPELKRQADDLAFAIVMRIFRERLKDAVATLSFANVILEDAERRRLEKAESSEVQESTLTLDDQVQKAAKAAQGLTMPSRFGSHRRII